MANDGEAGKSERKFTYCDIGRKLASDVKAWGCLVVGGLKNNSDPLIAFFSLALVIVGVLQWCTFRSTERVLEKTDETLRFQQRAWVEPLMMEMKTGLRRGESLSYVLKWRNVGKEPAINIVMQSEPRSADIPSVGLFALWLPGENEWCKSAKPNKNGAVAWPTSEPTNVLYTAASLPDSEGIWDKKKFLLIEGCIGYETVGGQHFSSFCYYARPGANAGEWQISRCMNHHSAD